MAYQRGDTRFGSDYRYGGGERWRDRDRDRFRERGFGGGYERGAGDWSGRSYGDDDRGFFERAGDEMRSWFGDEEAERRREADRRRWEREQGYGGDRDRGDDHVTSRRFGSGYSGSDQDRSSDRYATGDYGQDASYSTYSDYGEPAETWGGSGFGGYPDRGRRFDRIDAGSTGTHGAHPMSAPVGGGYGSTAFGAGYGLGSSARYAAIVGSRGRRRTQAGGDVHDRNYAEWRNRHLDMLDRDYDEYRREHQQQFDQEFGGWRQKRQAQRSSLGRVTEHMEVVGSDGQPIGTVDKVRGDRIILTRSDPEAGGHHHSIPCSWIESVDDKVTVNKSAEQAQSHWRDEDHNRALFEREDQGSEGRHMLNRSFSGTY